LSATICLVNQDKGFRE